MTTIDEDNEVVSWAHDCHILGYKFLFRADGTTLGIHDFSPASEYVGPSTNIWRIEKSTLTCDEPRKHWRIDRDTEKMETSLPYRAAALDWEWHAAVQLGEDMIVSLVSLLWPN